MRGPCWWVERLRQSSQEWIAYKNITLPPLSLYLSSPWNDWSSPNLPLCETFFLRIQTEVHCLMMRNTQQTNVKTASKSNLMNKLVGWGYSQEKHEGSLTES